MTRLVPEVDNRGIAFVPEYRHGRRGQGKMPHFARADERALIPPRKGYARLTRIEFETIYSAADAA